MTELNQAADQLKPASPAQAGNRKLLGELLVAAGILKQPDIDRILQLQKKQGLLFGEAAVKLGLLEPAQILPPLAQQYGYPYLNPQQSQYSQELVMAFQPFSAQAEAFRSLRSELLQNWFNDPANKALAFLGLGETTGCSFICANLAVSFSQLGLRTLLIDTDLRKPRLHEIFGLSSTYGFADALAGRIDLAQAIQKLPDIADLSILPTGAPPPNPQELLAKPIFKQVLQTLAAQYDVILIDTTNGLLYADFKPVLATAGGAVLTSRNHHSFINDIRILQQQISGAQAKLVGVVLNEF